MKLYETIQKNMAAMGFTPNQQQNSQRQLSSGQIFCIFKCSMDLTATTVYIFRNVERIDECIDAISSLTVIGGVLIAFVSIILKNDKLFKIMELSTEELTLSNCSKIFRFFLNFNKE